MRVPNASDIHHVGGPSGPTRDRKSGLKPLLPPHHEDRQVRVGGQEAGVGMEYVLAEAGNVGGHDDEGDAQLVELPVQRLVEVGDRIADDLGLRIHLHAGLRRQLGGEGIQLRPELLRVVGRLARRGTGHRHQGHARVVALGQPGRSGERLAELLPVGQIHRHADMPIQLLLHQASFPSTCSVSASAWACASSSFTSAASPLYRLTDISRITMPNGKPVASARACSDDSPPPSMSAMPISPRNTHQNTRWAMGASILPPAVIVSTTSAPESIEVTKKISTSRMPMPEVSVASGYSARNRNSDSSGWKFLTVSTTPS